MRARLVAPALAVVGFMITLGFALWQGRAAHPVGAEVAPAPMAQAPTPRPQPPPVQAAPQPTPAPEPEATLPAETPAAAAVTPPDPETTLPNYGDDSDRQRQARIANRRDNR